MKRSTRLIGKLLKRTAGENKNKKSCVAGTKKIGGNPCEHRLEATLLGAGVGGLIGLAFGPVGFAVGLGLGAAGGFLIDDAMCRQYLIDNYGSPNTSGYGPEAEKEAIKNWYRSRGKAPPTSEEEEFMFGGNAKSFKLRKQSKRIKRTGGLLADECRRQGEMRSNCEAFRGPGVGCEEYLKVLDVCAVFPQAGKERCLECPPGYFRQGCRCVRNS